MRLPNAPIKLSDRFFTDDELYRIFAMIADNNHLIDKYCDSPETTPSFCSNVTPIPGLWLGFFGAASYWQQDHEKYLASGEKTRQLLLDTVPYDKIAAAVREETGLDCKIPSHLNPPGFHIFNNSTDKPQQVQIKNWHQDIFHSNFLDSWLVPVGLPTLPCGIDYLNSTGEPQRFNYKLNELYAWGGGMRHTISEVTLLPGEQRISLQCHTLRLGDDVFLFW